MFKKDNFSFTFLDLYLKRGYKAELTCIFEAYKLNCEHNYTFEEIKIVRPHRVKQNLKYIGQSNQEMNLKF